MKGHLVMKWISAGFAWPVYNKQSKHAAKKNTGNRVAGNRAGAGGTTHIKIIEKSHYAANNNAGYRPPEIA